MGNVATPSNETDRLSYLHSHVSTNSHASVTRAHETTNTCACIYIYIYTARCKREGGTCLPAGNRPTNHPYICVLKGIQEYILHMLYCRLISNSAAAAALEEDRSKGARARARECILPPQKAARINGSSFTLDLAVQLSVNVSLKNI